MFSPAVHQFRTKPIIVLSTYLLQINKVSQNNDSKGECDLRSVFMWAGPIYHVIMLSLQLTLVMLQADVRSISKKSTIAYN